tara:strand:+ start:1962 stop:2453 length:492 start_codon:yes stop_codon:yes gene_type:complete
MFALGIPKRQYRRTTQVLGPYMSTPTNYNAVKQDDGFYLFTFPDVDEIEFRDLVNLLKRNGITTIGADSQLTEKRIMKLADLIKPLHEQKEKGNKGYEAARELIAKLREKTYRSFSDEELDAFSKEMVLHFIDNPAAEAAVKMRNAKSKSNEYKPGTTDELPF